jgi:Xaa-Pro aminopeptidase
MGDSSRPDWSGRLSRAWSKAAADHRAALVITTPTNLLYICGFEGSQGVLLLTATGHSLLLDGRYEQATREAIAAGRVGPVDVKPVPSRFEQALATALASDPARVTGEVAFEADHVTVATLHRWQRAIPDRVFAPTSGLIEDLRAIKDAGELKTIREACRRLSEVACHLKDWVAADRTEREVAADIDAALSRAGFSRPAFATIVASGPNSAHPHARPTDRRLAKGDLVVLDFGGVLDGYCGDLTRMAVIGHPEPRAQALVDAVRAAQDAAIAAVRAGAVGSDVDAAARQTLTDRGLGEAFVHATGHGLGLDVHEAPRLGRDTASPVRLETGMVCTIEPGAYVDGFGGVRLEDDVLVTAEGCEVLTTAPRELLIV